MRRDLKKPTRSLVFRIDYSVYLTMQGCCAVEYLQLPAKLLLAHSGKSMATVASTAERSKSFFIRNLRMTCNMKDRLNYHIIIFTLDISGCHILNRICISFLAFLAPLPPRPYPRDNRDSSSTNSIYRLSSLLEKMVLNTVRTVPSAIPRHCAAFCGRVCREN